MNAAMENLRVKQCDMLLAHSSSRHPAVTPGQTRAALLQVIALDTAWLLFLLCNLGQ